jgi:hypothetical protein
VARRISRDATDSNAADSPAKATAAADAGAKAARAGAATAAAAAGGEGRKGAEAGKSQRSVSDFAREVAALQEENKMLKQLLHTQVRPWG